MGFFAYGLWSFCASWQERVVEGESYFLVSWKHRDIGFGSQCLLPGHTVTDRGFLVADSASLRFCCCWVVLETKSLMNGPLEGTHPDHRGLNMHIWGWRVSSGCGFITIASLHCHKSLAKPWKGVDILHSKVCMPCACVMAHMWKSEYNMGVALGLLPCLRWGYFVVSHHVSG